MIQLLDCRPTKSLGAVTTTVPGSPWEHLVSHVVEPEHPTLSRPSPALISASGEGKVDQYVNKHVIIKHCSLALWGLAR